MKTSIHYDQLLEAVKQGILSEDQAQELWDFLSAERKKSTPFSTFLYYVGALIVIGAMSWFMNTAWEQFGGIGLCTIAVSYALSFIIFGRYVSKNSIELSGILYVMAVCMTPLAVYGLQKALGYWPQNAPGQYHNFYHFVSGNWFAMELTTLIAGFISLKFARIPFATLPIAVTLWFMSMDITPLIFGTDQQWTARKLVSIAFGLFMLLTAFLFDRRYKIDYAKWLYIFGTAAFWSALTFLDSHSELSKLLYCLFNILLMLSGVLLERKVLIFFGALGMFGYIGHLAWTVFKHSLFFPFALSLLGLALVWSGWFYHKHHEKIIKILYKVTPDWFIRHLPQNRQKF